MDDDWIETWVDYIECMQTAERRGDQRRAARFRMMLEAVEQELLFGPLLRPLQGPAWRRYASRLLRR